MALFVLFEARFDLMLTHLEVADVLEDEGVVDVDGFADLVVHGVHISLVHSHALFGQG